MYDFLHLYMAISSCNANLPALKQGVHFTKVLHSPAYSGCGCDAGTLMAWALVFGGRLKRSARAVQLFGRTRDPYFEILGAPRGIMVTRSGGFEF